MSKIQWTDATWNPVRGCSVVSAGCENCYAMRQAHRFSGPGRAYEGLTRMTSHGPKWTGKVRLVPEKLDEPLRWRKSRRVFVNSMSDLFHEDVPFEYIDRVLAVTVLSDRHTFQILTKRAARMHAYFGDPYRWALIEGAAQLLYDQRTGEDPSEWLAVHDLPNVHLGVSVESQETADERIPLLLQTPAAVRFLSCEPLLGEIDLDAWFRAKDTCGSDWENGGIHWVIVGGESGPGARPCNVEWIRSIVEQCKDGVPCFVKQLGAAPFYGGIDCGPPNEHFGRYGIRLQDRKGSDPAEWPVDLRVREFPTAPTTEGVR